MMALTAEAIAGRGMTSMRTRMRMVKKIKDNGISDRRVLAALEDVPRHLFVDEAMASRAYEDTALPIGSGQTISKPSTVALMTQALIEKELPINVLEVGTGSGYQSSVLSRIAGIKTIYSVERIAAVLEGARHLHRQLGYKNVYTRHVDGQMGWPDKAPYDAIIVTACIDNDPPPALLEQLKVGGCMVIPLGTDSGKQKLVRVYKEEENFQSEVLDDVHFVPLLRDTSYI